MVNLCANWIYKSRGFNVSKCFIFSDLRQGERWGSGSGRGAELRGRVEEEGQLVSCAQLRVSQFSNQLQVTPAQRVWGNFLNIEGRRKSHRIVLWQEEISQIVAAALGTECGNLCIGDPIRFTGREARNPGNISTQRHHTEKGKGSKLVAAISYNDEKENKVFYLASGQRVRKVMKVIRKLSQYLQWLEQFSDSAAIIAHESPAAQLYYIVSYFSTVFFTFSISKSKLKWNQHFFHRSIKLNSLIKVEIM